MQANIFYFSGGNIMGKFVIRETATGIKFDLKATNGQVIATSEVSVSLTVNTKADLSGLIADLEQASQVSVRKEKAIVTIICDAAHSSAILASGFQALAEEGINVQMISQGASKVNISMIVDADEADKTIQILHSAYFN